jgi:plastocyanin
MRKRTVQILMGVTIAAAMLLTAGAALAETFGIRATTSRTWNPKHRYVTKGDTIKWRNPTGRRHNIRAYGGNWSYSTQLPAGTSRSRRFGSTGTYRYRCSLHSTLSNGACSGMCGIIHVFSG